MCTVDIITVFPGENKLPRDVLPVRAGHNGSLIVCAVYGYTCIFQTLQRLSVRMPVIVVRSDADDCIFRPGTG